MLFKVGNDIGGMRSTNVSQVSPGVSWFVIDSIGRDRTKLLIEIKESGLSSEIWRNIEDFVRG
jgi:hypothetical protein